MSKMQDPLAPNNGGTGKRPLTPILGNQKREDHPDPAPQNWGGGASPTPPQDLTGVGAGGRAGAASLGTALTAVFAASVLLPPPGADGQIGHLPSLCPFYNLTGLPCPGCGLTRAFVCLGHGQWRESLHWHPLGGLIFLLFALLWLRAGLFWWRGVTLLPLLPRTVSRLAWAAAALLLVFGLARIGWLTAHHLRF